MAFSKVRIAPIQSMVSNDGYPIYGAFEKLQEFADGVELNAVELTFSDVVKEKTYQADDREEIKKVIVRGEGKLKVYGCDQARAIAMFGHSRDINGNTIDVMNSGKKRRFGMFFESKTAHDVKFQKYIYDIGFDEPEFSAATDTGEEVATLEISFDIRFLTVNGYMIKGATVYEGRTGWVTGEPATMYRQAPSDSYYLSAPVISLSNLNVVSWAAVENAIAYIVFVNGVSRGEQTGTSFAALTTQGTYSIVVVAKGDGITYLDSATSNAVGYTV
jgi:hypothetical protein